MTVFSLRTSFNHLNHHLYLRIGQTEQWPCGSGSQTTKHLLQSCPIYEPLRKGIWPNHTPIARKLYGGLGDLQCTATFIEETGVSIRRTRRWKKSVCKCPNASKTYSFVVVVLIKLTSVGLSPFNQISSEMSECMPALNLFDAVSKTAVISCDSINLTKSSSIQDFQLELLHNH